MICGNNGLNQNVTNSLRVKKLPNIEKNDMLYTQVGQMYNKRSLQMLKSSS